MDPRDHRRPRLLDRLRHALVIGAAAVTASALVGCTAEAPTRSGGRDDPVTLRISAYTPNAPVPETADRLQALGVASGTGLSFVRLPNVELPDSEVADPSTDLIRQVRDGSVDVGVVASRSFDLLGATSLQAFNAPLVVDTPDQAVRLLADPVTEQMLAGTSAVGVVGLSLAYNQLRQPVGYGRPILTPADLRGAFVIGRNSRANKELFASLGATLHVQSNAADAASVASGEADAAELSFDHPLGAVSGPADRPSYVTGNVQLAVLASVIIVNPKTWAGLSRSQQHALRSAATGARDWAATQAPRLDAARDHFCDQRVGNVAVADAPEMAAWRAAVAPFVDRLRSADPVTAAALDRAREIAAEHPATGTLTPCTMEETASSDLVAKGDQSVVAGVWRFEVLADRLAAAEATPEEVRLNSGTWTLTLEPTGTYSYVEPRGRTCSGRFVVDGTSLRMVEDGGTCDGRWRFIFTRSGNRLEVRPTADFADDWAAMTAFFSQPWVRIGDAPAP